MQAIDTCASFLRTLLEKCIGTVMIEWEQWEFPEPSFDRGYFNARLKKSIPVNALTRKRLSRLFEAVLRPGDRTGRFQEPQAAEAANAFIDLAGEKFQVDLSVWKNSYTGNNSVSRSHLLDCINIILSLLEGQEILPEESVTDALSRYMDDVQSCENISAPDYPRLLNSALYGQTEHFVGRRETVDSLVGQLISGRSCYLHGIGGIGKTEIAKAVLKKIKEIPSSDSGITHIMWINYTEENFALSLIRSLNIDKNIHNIEQEFQKALAIINQYQGRLLLIIDNVENADDKYLLSLADYLDCRILVTSRCAGFSSLLEAPVSPLSESECMTLFYAYYHGASDDITLRKIIRLADCHTVTVELLAKIADSEEMLLYEFYESLIRCGFDISEEEVTASHEKMQTEGRVIEQLKKLFYAYGCSPEERSLLMQTSTIPNIHFVFEQARKWFGLKNRTVLNKLANKGWLKKEGHLELGRNRYQYYMHSVIASAVRAQFLDELYHACQGFIREITIEMKECLDQNDAAKKELIQFSWSLNDIFRGKFQSEEDCQFLWTLAEIYRDIGYYERALPLLESLEDLYIRIYGEDCIQLGSVWNSRGMIEYELSHFADALTAYQESRDIIEAHLSSGNVPSSWKIELAKLDLNTGKIYLKFDFTKADPFFGRAYTVFQQEEGNDSLLTQNALGHCAMLLERAGQLEEAEKIFLDIYNRTKRETDDRELLFLHAGAAHHLGSIYSDYAPAKAMPFLTEARDIFWNLLSPTHPDTLDVLNTICNLRLSTEEDYPQLLADFHHLLELFIKAYGPDDPNTGTIYNNIGLCHYYMEEYDKAIENYREALRIDAVTYGEDHEATAYIYNNIGAVYSEMNLWKKAIGEHEHALKIFEEAYPNHLNLDLALTHADLAGAYLPEGDFEKVKEHLNEAFSIYRRMLPENAHQLIYPYTILANWMAAEEEYDTAENSYAHVIWLMLENGYAEDSEAVQQFQRRIEELRGYHDIGE